MNSDNEGRINMKVEKIVDFYPIIKMFLDHSKYNKALGMFLQFNLFFFFFLSEALRILWARRLPRHLSQGPAIYPSHANILL